MRTSKAMDALQWHLRDMKLREEKLAEEIKTTQSKLDATATERMALERMIDKITKTVPKKPKKKTEEPQML